MESVKLLNEVKQLKSKDINRWWKYDGNGMGGMDWKYIFSNKSNAKDIASEWFRCNTPYSGQWRGFTLRAIKRPPLEYLKQELKDVEEGIKSLKNRSVFIKTEIQLSSKSKKIKNKEQKDHEIFMKLNDSFKYTN